GCAPSGGRAVPEAPWQPRRPQARRRGARRARQDAPASDADVPPPGVRLHLGGPGTRFGHRTWRSSCASRGGGQVAFERSIRFTCLLRSRSDRFRPERLQFLGQRVTNLASPTDHRTRYSPQRRERRGPPSTAWEAESRAAVTAAYGTLFPSRRSVSSVDERT